MNEPTRRAKLRKAIAKFDCARVIYEEGVALLREAVPRDHTNHEPYQYHIEAAAREIDYAYHFAKGKLQ